MLARDGLTWRAALKIERRLPRPRARRLVRPRNRDRSVLLLTRRDGSVTRMCLSGRCRGSEGADGRRLGRGGVDLDGWCLEGEWLCGGGEAGARGVDEASSGRGGAGAFFSVGGGSGEGGGEAGGFHVRAVGGGEGAEAGGVWGGLGAKLGEVQVGAGFVAVVHCLAELALGVVAVEDDAVDGNGDGLDDHFDDAADDGPGLGFVSWLAVGGGSGGAYLDATD